MAPVMRTTQSIMTHHAKMDQQNHAQNVHTQIKPWQVCAQHQLLQQPQLLALLQPSLLLLGISMALWTLWKATS